MRKALAWVAVAVLCCAAAPADEAQVAYERAKTLYERGRYSEALFEGERALGLWEKTGPGSLPPEAARCLEVLGVIHQLRGEMTEAESLLRRGLELRETAFGFHHPEVASSLNHLASLYKAQGAYDRAAPLYERALAIQEKALGKDHPQAAVVLNNLARLSSAQGRYGDAEPLHPRALTIQEAALGKHHPGLAPTLNDLASLYLELGSYARAEPLAARALAIQEKALGRKHPAVAESLHNLARVFAGQGAFDKAEDAYERALGIVQATQGRNHPYVAELLNSLAQLHVVNDDLDDALPLMKRAFAISELRLRRESLDLSESRLASFVAQLRTQEELLYELARAAPRDEDVRHLALTAALLRKGRSVEQVADTSRTTYQRANARDRDAFKRLRGLRSELASLSLQGPGALAPGDYQRRLQELTAQGDALEAQLARSFAPLRARTSLPRPEDTVERVAEALPGGSVLIELVAYVDRSSLRKPGTAEPRSPPQLRYLALVLLPGGRTHAADLGPAAPIDSAAEQLRDALARRDADYLLSTQVLYQRVLRPLWRFLDGARQVFVSPDGQLGLIPFAALHDGHQFLVDVHDFTYLTSGRDLLPRSGREVVGPRTGSDWLMPSREKEPSRSVVVLADPDFDSLLAPAAGKPLEVAERSAFIERFFSRRRTGLAELPWTPLPGTRAEAEAIQRLIPRAELFLGPQATKERLLNVSAPGVLHLATHGFFLEDAAAQESTRAVSYFGALGEGASDASPADPLLRSGLILAGARASAPSGAARPPPEDSMVTALELAGLDLWGTQLVVLSACDTGRGDVKLGQGVYGLRRAFLVAGAETVVMSLWKVDDAVTRELMEGYYHHLLKGQGRALALREAMRELRRTQPHPHYWAPFIAMGRETPLRL